MKLDKGQTIELTIDKMAYGGQGVGRVNGFVVFVRGAVSGDRVKARIHRKKKDYAQAVLIELLESSPDRVEAPCPYSSYCGGCQWQNVSYEKQLDYKKTFIKESMEHIGGVKNTIIHDVIPSEKILAYRNKMEFSFSNRRWFLPHEMDNREKEGGFALGLHVPESYHKIIDMKACLLQQERGNQILLEVKEYIKNCGIPIYDMKTHEGLWRFLVIRYSTAFDEWMVNVVTSEECQEVLEPLSDILCDQIGQIKTVINNINQRKASIAIGDTEIILAGEGYIEDKIGPYTFHISANSFFQTNSIGAQKLYQKAIEYAELKGSDMVLDLYSGIGTIPIFLANKVRAVTGIEITKNATLDAQRNCKRNAIDNCHFICGDIREELATINFMPDVLIIDPPRAGMHKDVLAQVLALSPERIIYISCNPTTMARDIGQMTKYYDLVEIQPVDMFPQTYHIEAVAKLWLKKQ